MTSTHNASGRKRVIFAAGALLGAAALFTAASFTDFANLNLGGGSDDSGIGGNNRFNIQVVGTDQSGLPLPGTWQEAATEEGVSIAIPGADTLTPGESVSVEIPFRNESPVLLADMTFGLQDRAGFLSDPDMAQALRYTVALDGVGLVADVPQSEVTGLQIDNSSDPTGHYGPGDDGILSVTISLPDQGSEELNNALQGKVSYIQAHLDATSVVPNP